MSVEEEVERSAWPPPSAAVTVVVALHADADADSAHGTGCVEYEVVPGVVGAAEAAGAAGL